MPAAQLHPNILGAIAALHDLRDQWQWLADLLEPGTPDRRSRHLTPAAKANLNRLHRAERADLTETRRQGLAPRGASPAPLRIAVLDAQIIALATATDAAWAASSALRTRPMLAYVMPIGDDHRRFEAAGEYLTVTLALIHPDLAGSIGTDLDAAARTARTATGAGPGRKPLAATCPACGRRSLVATTYDTDDAIVTCDRGDCRCRGVDCLCRRPQRSPGGKHMWAAAEFGQLDRLLSRVAA